MPDNAHRFGDLLSEHEHLHLAIVDARNARVLASFSRIAMESLSRLPAHGASQPWRWQATDGRQYVSLAGDGPVATGEPVRYVLSLYLEDRQRLQGGFVQAILLGLPVLLALVALGAWLVARTGLAPLRRLSAVASEVTTHNLPERFTSAGLPAELRGLASNFNAMLDRIDVGVQRLSEISADLAHEMRTQVATLLGRTQVALSKARTVAELQEVLAGNVDALDRLTRLIADMLFLARADQGGAVVARTTVDLGEEADRTLVQRAITNLLTNAIRHALVPSVVTIAIRREGRCARVDVVNQGSGIPDDQRARIFERFVRLDEARSRAEGAGTGLGLPIVCSIMQAHGGRVELTNTPDGVTTFTLSFPDR